MRKRQMAKIEAALMRLQEGDLYKPVKIEGAGVYHAITKRLETLRLTLLKLGDGEVEFARRNNTAIASVAHDMKTPLAIISGYAECMADGMDDKDYPELILQKAQQMNEMVLSLVETSHAELEKQAEQKTLENAHAYFSEVMFKIQPIADAKDIKLKVSKIPSEQIRIDKQQFERVMQNLISNAVKYSPSGSKIRVYFGRWGKRLNIHVVDNGIGIAKEHLPYVFDQFYKEDRSRTDSSSNGLGLYITKEIVTQHGGTISVRSKKGKKSVFLVSIPIEPNLDEKLTLTGRFDRLAMWKKLLFETFFGWIMASVYRIARYFESRCMSTLFGGILCIALFPFMWMIDVLSVIVYGRMTFLTD